MTGQSQYRIMLVGAGNMGGALLAGWLDAGIAPSRICVVDPQPSPAMCDLMKRRGVESRKIAASDWIADVAVLAVKPQIFAEAARSVRPAIGDETVVISVAAGIPLARMAAVIGQETAIVRAMPNTPALIGQGITIACANEQTNSVQRDRTEQLLAATGSFDWVEEEALIDAVTAVSGSGPAYVFHLAECMADAGIREGLPPALAMKLARETIAGAGELLRRSPETAEQLRKNVTSPNGTTEAALSVLMAEPGLRELMERAIGAARRRSLELSK